MAVKAIPDSYNGMIPALAFNGAAEAIEYYKKAFGATERMRMVDPSGKIAHAELNVGTGVIMLSEEHPEYNKSPRTLGGAAVVLFFYVEDCDAVLAQAVTAGGKLLMPAKDQFYGDRSGRIEDPFGYTWVIGTHKEDLSDEELRRRFDEVMKPQP